MPIQDKILTKTQFAVVIKTQLYLDLGGHVIELDKDLAEEVFRAIIKVFPEFAPYYRR